jgi:hypothetical protein
MYEQPEPDASAFSFAILAEGHDRRNPIGSSSQVLEREWVKKYG